MSRHHFYIIERVAREPHSVITSSIGYKSCAINSIESWNFCCRNEALYTRLPRFKSVYHFNIFTFFKIVPN